MSKIVKANRNINLYLWKVIEEYDVPPYNISHITYISHISKKS